MRTKLVSLVLIFSIILSMCAVFTPKTSATENVIFQDNFESYGAGTFPSSGGWQIVWNGAGDQYQVITSSYSHSGTQSLQLIGRWDWSSVTKKDFSSSSDVIGYEGYIMTTSTAADGSIGFFNRPIDTWGRFYAGVGFANGNVACGSTVFQPISPYTWYKVRVVLDKNTRLFNVWINGALVAQNLVEQNDPHEILSLQVSTGWSGQPVYFDDVKVFEVGQAPPPTGVPIISWVSPITATNLQTIHVYGSGFGNTQPQTVPAYDSDGSVDTVFSSTTPCMGIGNNGVPPDAWAAGVQNASNYVHCAIGIYLTSWSDTEIILGGFGTALNTNGQGPWNIAPGDPLDVAVFTQSGEAHYKTTVVGPTTYSVTINAGAGGSVSYSYSGGSDTVLSGQSQQLTVSQGGKVYLTANPDPTYCFQTWGVDNFVSIPSSDLILPSVTATINGNVGIWAYFVPKTVTSTSVTCSPNSVCGSSSVLCQTIVSGFNPTGSVAWTTTPSNKGSFSQSTCILARTSAGLCSTTYTPFTPDASSGTTVITITATYSGDSNNEPSSGSTTLAVRPRINQETIVFSGYTWDVTTSDTPKTPGPNYWSDNTENVWVDQNGWLHLKITQDTDGKWRCADVSTTQPLGYGTYVFYTANRVDTLDKNVVFGLFGYKDDDHEADIEFTRLGDIAKENAWFTVQPPPYSVSNQNSFNIELTGDYSTHFFAWSRNNVFFESFYGHYPIESIPPSNVIQSWQPPSPLSIDAAGAKAHINLWLFHGSRPSDGQEVEVVIKEFKFYPGRAIGSSTLENGATMQDQTVSTGVSVSITGSSAPDGTLVTISTTPLSGAPAGLLEVGTTPAAYYDVNVQGISDGTATVCITNSGVLSQTTMQYWNGAQWVEATDVVVSGNTICGDIPVSALSGTPIAIGPLGVHDVAVTSAVAVVPHCSSKVGSDLWVFQGLPVYVNVTVLNKGDFDENVSVTLYYNITTGEMIGTQNITIPTGENHTLSFVWDTASVPYCHNYTITAVATIPLDNNTADNTLACGPITVRILGDINGDGRVNLEDVFKVALAFGTVPGDSKWNSDADINGDGKINLRDFFTICLNYGKTDT